MFYGPANHRKFHRWKRDKSIIIFLCCKTSRNGIEPRQDLYLSLRKLSNLSRSVAFWQSIPRCFLFG